MLEQYGIEQFKGLSGPPKLFGFAYMCSITGILFGVHLQVFSCLAFFLLYSKNILGYKTKLH